MAAKTRREVLTPAVLLLVGVWFVSRRNRDQDRRRRERRRRQNGVEPGDRVRLRRPADLELEGGQTVRLPAGTRLQVRTMSGVSSLVSVQGGDHAGSEGRVKTRDLER